MPWQCEHCGAVHDEQAERTFGDLSIIKRTRELWCNDRRMKLSPALEGIAFDLLCGRPVSREALAMRYAREDSCDFTIDTQVSKLRRRLVELGSAVRIESCYANGWQMIYDEQPYEQRRFGDFRIDLDRRILLKGKAVAPINPRTIEFFLVLISGELEPRERLEQLVDGPTEHRKRANARQQIQWAREALAQIGSAATIKSFSRHGYQLKMAWGEGHGGASLEA